MKKSLRLLTALMVAIVGLAFTSCGDDDDDIKIWDFSPVSIRLDIVDTEGNDLLDADTPGNILESELTATFDGKEYTLATDDDPDAGPLSVKSREILSQFYGLYIQTPDHYFTEGKHNLLCFGEFKGFENFDHTVIFHFPTADRDITVRVVSKARWDGDTPNWELEYYLDGQQINPGQGMWSSGIKIILND